MNPTEHDLIHQLVRRQISLDDFLRRFRVENDGSQLSAKLIQDAMTQRDVMDLSAALVVGFIFGFVEEHKPMLCDLAAATWHKSHEDVISALADFKDPATIDVLFQATQWVPEYLNYDDARALATKAIWGLGGIGSAAAVEKLRLLSESPDEPLRETALENLEVLGVIPPRPDTTMEDLARLVMRGQVALHARGYDPGAIDGIFGEKTSAAL